MFGKILDVSLLIVNSAKFFVNKGPINRNLLLKKELYNSIKEESEPEQTNGYPNIEGNAFVLTIPNN